MFLVKEETLLSMKQLLTSLFVIGLIISCKKVDQLTQFEMSFENEAVISNNIGVNLPFNLNTTDTETNSEATFEVNDTRKDKIEQIILTDLRIELTSPAGADFSFLKKINLYLNAEGLDEALIAWKDPVPSSDTVLVLEVTGADMQEYIKKDQFSLRINATTDEVLGSDHHLLISSTYFVDAKVLGQ